MANQNRSELSDALADALAGAHKAHLEAQESVAKIEAVLAEGRDNHALSDVLRRNLAKATRHVADSERHVARQRALASRLERDGHDATESKKLLTRFEQMLRLHAADRDRLKKALADLPPTP
jgi:hypothetical protein